jgi:uncharacterized protein (TIGR02246 family)
MVQGLTSLIPAAALAAGGAAAGAAGGANTGGAKAAAADRAARVKQVVDRYQAAWNASDMAAMAALYTPDVHWVNVVGMHWQGREDVDYAHRILFDQSFRGVTSTPEEIESIVPLPGGGAVAVVRWAVGAYRTPAGDTMPAGRTRMSLTLVPDGDRYRIAHGANIAIVEPARRADPIVQRRARARARAPSGAGAEGPP